MPVNQNYTVFRKQVLAYCRENNLPPPAGDQFFVRKDETDLLLVSGTDESTAVVWADLGKVHDFRDEEKLLSIVLGVSSQLSPLHGIFIGLDAHSERIMLRATFLMTNNDSAKPLSNFLAETAKQIKEMKASLNTQLHQ